MSMKDIVGKWLGVEAAPARPPLRNGKASAYPEPGDVVFLRIPSADNPNRPAAHSSYGIVVKAMTSDGLNLLVVPANFNAPIPTRACEFHMPDRSAARDAGLRQPATFDLRQSRVCGWTAKWSEPGVHPIVGRLTDRDFERFQVSYRAWLAMQRAANEAQKPAAPAAPAPAYNPEIAKLIRNKGKEDIVWA